MAKTNEDSAQKKRHQVSNKIQEFLSFQKNSIKSTVEEIGSQRLTPTSHEFSQYGPKIIRDVALIASTKYTNQARSCPPLSIIDVVLAANREYNVMVQPVMDDLKKEMTNEQS